MKLTILIASLFVVAAAASVACNSGNGDAPPTTRVSSSATTAPAATIPANLTLDDVYAQMERALDGGADRVLHASIVVVDYSSPLPTPPPPFDWNSLAQQVWIDVARKVARYDSRPLNETVDVSRRIVSADGTFRVSPDGSSSQTDPRPCQATGSVLLGQLILCDDPTEKSTTTVEPGEYDGKAAIILVTTGTISDSDGKYAFTRRLYVDPASYVPVAADDETTIGRAVLKARARYDVEFVDRSSLAANFFEPEGIGWVQPTPTPTPSVAREVDGMVVYWLGRDFGGAPGVPPLTLIASRTVPREKAPQYRVTLSYDEQGGTEYNRALEMQEWPTAKWDSTRLGISGRPEEVQVPGARATLYPQAAGAGYVSVVRFDTTVVFMMDVPERPRLSRDAWIEVIKALRPYE